MKKLCAHFTLLLVLVGVFTSFKNAGQAPFNVIWLDLEDMSPHFDVYGDSTVKTPNISRIAREGIVFKKAYACAGVCAPSRASIITGVHPATLGAHHMRVEARPKYTNVPAYEVVPDTNIRCFPDLLREQGIYTICSKKTDYQFAPSPFTWDAYSKNDEIDRYVIPKQRPFFKQINFWETHESQIWDWCRKNVPLSFDSSRVKLPPYLPNLTPLRNDLITQYNNLRFVDQKIGAIYAALEKEGILEQTVIIITGDHGDGLPRAKRTLFESGVRVPLIIRLPQKQRANTEVQQLVSLMDLGPTILALYNIKAPNYMQGTNMLEANNRSYLVFSADRFDERTDFIRGITDGTFKYIRYFRPDLPMFMDLSFRKNQEGVRALYALDSALQSKQQGLSIMTKTKPNEALYDLRADPYELQNLAQNLQYQSELNRLRAALNNWMIQQNDKGFIPESELARIFWPQGIQPRTEAPIITPDNKSIRLRCATPGASVAYKIGTKGRWLFYKSPIALSVTDTLYAMAHRLGFTTSTQTVYIQKK